MLPTRGNTILLLLVAFCVAANSLPFNAKYRFTRDVEESSEEDTGSGSGSLSERDNISNGTAAAQPDAAPAANATAPKEAENTKKVNETKADNEPKPAAKEAKADEGKAEEDKAKAAFGEGQSLTSSEMAPAKDAALKTEGEADKDKTQSAVKEGKKEDEKKKEAHNKSSIEEASDESSEESNEESSDDQSENADSNEEANEASSTDESEVSGDDVKMFFISPFDRNNEEDASQRQILTYPAKSKGWGNTHQFGPSHIWNSDYPYFAYGYSWGCGHHGYGPQGHVKRSGMKGKKADTLCRDYVLVPAVSQAPAVLAPSDYQNGVARDFVSKDIACNDGDTECAQRQVIGSMAGGSMFGDGMGGLGLGFPGVPGIHTGISGYNMAGGFGDHMGHSGGHGGHGGGHGAGHHGGHHGGHGVGHGAVGGHHGGVGVGGFGPSHFFKSNEHGIPSYWSGRAAIPRNFIGAGGFGRGGYGGNTFFQGEDMLPIHEASNGVGSGFSYGHGSAQWWDKTPRFGEYGLGHGDQLAGLGHGDAYLGGSIQHGAYGGGFGADEGIHGGDISIDQGFAGNGINGLGGYGNGYGYGGNGYGLGRGNGLGDAGLGGHGIGLGNGGIVNGVGVGGHGIGLGDGGLGGNGIGLGDAGIVNGVGLGGHGIGLGDGGIGGHGAGYGGGWALGGHDNECCDNHGAGHFGLDGGHGITYTHTGGNDVHIGVGHAVGGHHGFVKSSIKRKSSKSSKKSKTAKATARQDIAMPDEQAMMDVTKQRQLIGSLGASTLFSDNVGGMGLGHPGVPQMSSGVAGIPGEYGGSGGYSHGWDGEGPGSHPHGYNNYGYNGGDHDERSEMPQPASADENAEKRTVIYSNGANSGRQVISGLSNAAGAAGDFGETDGFNNGFGQNSVAYANGDHGAMALGGFPGHGTTQVTSVHHHSISHNEGDDDGYVDGAGIGGGYGAGVGGYGAGVGGYGAGVGSYGPAVAGNVNGLGAGVAGGYRYGAPLGRGPAVLAGRPYHPRHVHVGVGTPGVKVEVETAKSTINKQPAVHVTAQKMSEIKSIVNDVSASLAKTSKKLKSFKKVGDKRQITPAFTPVVSEPVGVPSIRYPVPAADRYPLGAGYIWPSANYGHQYGGPYSWSKSNTPKAPKAATASKAKASKRHHKNTKKNAIEGEQQLQQQQQFAPNLRSVMPEPVFNERESSMYSQETPYGMESPEYMGAKKSSVPRRNKH